MRYQLNIILFLILVAFATDSFSRKFNVDSVLQKYDRHWEMQEGIYRVLKDGRIGVVNKSGRVVVPCRFDQVWTPTKDNYIRVLLDMKTGLYHLEKGIVLPAEYDQIWEFENGLAKVMIDRKFGYVNSDGLIIIPCEYHHIWAPQNNRMKVIKDGKTGYLDTSGRTIVPVVYQQIRDFKDGLARVVRDGKMGYIDEAGNEVVPAIYDQVWAFEGDEAMVFADGDYFKVNRQGKITEEVQPSDQKAPETTEKEAKSKESSPRIRIEKDHIDIRHDRDGGFESRQKKRRPVFNGHLAGAGLAYNGYVNAGGEEKVPDDYAFMDLNQNKSLEVSIYPFQESLRLIGGWFGLTTGIGLQYNNYRFNLDTYNDIDEDGREWFPEISASASISKSKLMVLHANVPVMAELQIPDRQGHNAFFLAGGVVGGVRLQTHTKLVFHDNDAGRQKKKKRDDMDIPTFRYGYMARAGYGNFSLYATYYPEPLFKADEGPELYPFSLGIMFYFD